MGWREKEEEEEQWTEVEGSLVEFMDGFRVRVGFRAGVE